MSQLSCHFLEYLCGIDMHGAWYLGRDYSLFGSSWRYLLALTGNRWRQFMLWHNGVRNNWSSKRRRRQHMMVEFCENPSIIIEPLCGETSRHYDDLTWTLYSLKSPVIRLFIFHLKRTYIKETSKSALLTFCEGNSPVKGQLRVKSFHLWCHNVCKKHRCYSLYA